MQPASFRRPATLSPASPTCMSNAAHVGASPTHTSTPRLASIFRHSSLLRALWLLPYPNMSIYAMFLQVDDVAAPIDEGGSALTTTLVF